MDTTGGDFQQTTLIFMSLSEITQMGSGCKYYSPVLWSCKDDGDDDAGYLCKALSIKTAEMSVGITDTVFRVRFLYFALKKTPEAE